MQHPLPTRRSPKPLRRKPSEDGYLLIAVMFLLFLLILSLSVAAPRLARDIQRDHDVETMERGKQYIRAVQLYYRKFHAYPPSVDALVKTNEIRFLRKKYVDPATGKDDWKPIMFGQNKVPIAIGFFGQPLATGSSIAGIGPSGGNGINGVNGSSPTGGAFNSNAGTGGSIFDTNGASSSASSTGTDAAGGPGTGTTSGATGSTTTGSTGGTDANGNPASGTGTGIGGQTGQTFGGAGIIGFEPGASKQSILIWKKKNHYNEWEFTYDPIMEMKTVGGGNPGIGQPASNTSSPFGSSSSPTTNPASSPSPTSPQ